MKRSERLSVVLQLAVRQEEAALDELSRAQRVLAAEEQRYKDLESYMSDYQGRIRAQMNGGLHVNEFMRFHHFFNQLNLAMEQQQARLTSLGQQVDRARKSWQSAHQKTQGMRDHIERCRAEEMRVENKKEQAMLDEFCQQNARSGRGR